MHADPELMALVETGRFDDLEERWLDRVEQAPEDTPFFVAVLHALVRAGQESRVATLVQLLLDALQERRAAAAELAFVRQALAVWPSAPELRVALAGAVRRAYADRPSLERVVGHFKLDESGDPQGTLERVEAWLRFDVGRAVLLPTRGLGHVVEINPTLSSVRVEFAAGERLSLKLDEAQKLLQPLDPGHFLHEKLERPAELAALAEADPGAVLEKLFASAGGPLGLSELRSLLEGLVPEERWAGWWKRAASDPRIASSGGKRPTYRWSTTGEAADETLRASFGAAAPRERLEIARKHAGRSPALGAFLARGVAETLRAARREDPSLALEAALLLEKLGEAARGADAETTPALLLDVEDPVPVVAGVEDRALRERALALLRQRRSDWPALYARLLRAETDTRTLTLLYDTLRREGGAEALARTVDDVLARPHTAPRLFVWLCRELGRRPELESRGDWGLLRRLLDALTLEAFRAMRAPLRELFDDGGLGERLASRLDRDQAEQLHAFLERELGLDEHRKDLMRRAVLRRHPELQEAEEAVLHTTAAGLERKRTEFERITKVDIPHNAQEIRKAAAHGDLSENFEYKAAREKHEMLSSRAKTLHDELRRAKVLDLEAIEPSAIRVGTRVTLEPTDGGAPRSLAILGPWDSDPAHGIVSYLAPAIQALLGRRPGDTVQFLDGTFVVGSIEVWREA